MECTASQKRTAPVKAGTKLSPRDDRRDLREWTKLTPAVGVVRGRVQRIMAAWRVVAGGGALV